MFVSKKLSETTFSKAISELASPPKSLRLIPAKLAKPLKFSKAPYEEL